MNNLQYLPTALFGIPQLPFRENYPLWFSPTYKFNPPTTVIRGRFVIQFAISFVKLAIEKLITSCFYQYVTMFFHRRSINERDTDY